MAIRSCRLIGLALELQSQIIDLLSPTHHWKELLSLSETCSFYRFLLAPHIFKTIQLANTSRSGLSVDAVAHGRHRDRVEALHYRGMAPGNSDERFFDIEAVFPDIVGNVLSNLNRFPNLHFIVFEFPFDWDEWEDHWELFMVPESSDDVRTAENKEGWRALMLKSFNALSSNPTLSVEDFEIKALPPKAVSTFESEEFHKFLGRLSRFRLSLREYDNGAGWAMNTTEGFPHFAERLDQFFFDHLQSATEFVLQADETGPLGMDPGRYHVHLALAPQQMPQLRRLEVKHIFVCPELVEFVVAHLDTLEEFVMVDCYCTMELLDADTEGMHWDALFDAISQGWPRKLKRFDVVWTNEIAEIQEWWKDSEKRDFKEMHRVVEDDPDKRVFPYINLDDKYGMLMEDSDEVLESFWKGDNQRAYDRLMHIVESNRARQR